MKTSFEMLILYQTEAARNLEHTILMLKYGDRDAFVQQRHEGGKKSFVCLIYI